MADVAWTMAGEYFENCNCDVLCPCIFTAAQAVPKDGHCEVPIVAHVEEGQYGDVSLDGLNFVLVLYTPGPMAQGNGSFAVYIDERADERQREALTAICSGEVGGAPQRYQAIAPDFKGVQFVPISFEIDGLKRSATIPGIMELSVEGIPGRNREEALCLDNTAHGMGRRLALARGGSGSTYKDYDWDWDNSGQNGHYTAFRWKGS